MINSRRQRAFSNFSKKFFHTPWDTPLCSLLFMWWRNPHLNSTFSRQTLQTATQRDTFTQLCSHLCNRGLLCTLWPWHLNIYGATYSRAENYTHTHTHTPRQSFWRQFWVQYFAKGQSGHADCRGQWSNCKNPSSRFWSVHEVHEAFSEFPPGPLCTLLRLPACHFTV